MTNNERLLRKEFRKAGIPTYREVTHGSHKVGPVHAGRRKVSFSQIAGIEVSEWRSDASKISVKYDKGWKNSPVHTADEIAAFIDKAVAIIESHNLVAVID